MIKYIGIFIIFFSSVMFGMYLVGRLTHRINILRSIMDMLKLFKREINYRMPTVSELFELCSELPISDFTVSVTSMLSEGESLEKSISASAELSSCLSDLTSEEKGSLTDILSSLGTTDSESQISIIENGIELFGEFLERAADDKKRNSKVYMSVSVYVGLAAAILFV